MARLTEDDKRAFRELTARGYTQSEAERSPLVMADTAEARERYIRWASENSKYFKSKQASDFGGDHWKL